MANSSSLRDTKQGVSSLGVTQISNSLTEGVDVNVEVYKTKEDFLLWSRYNTKPMPTTGERNSIGN